MDQAKWCLPRLQHHVISHEMAKYQRPRLKLHAVWCHHVGLYLFLVDPRRAADASLTVECAGRSLEYVAEKFHQAGKTLPGNLIAFCDNTVRENKNVTTLGYLSTLTALNRFRSTSMLLHRVGHSHGPLDQLFGVIATAMKYVDLLADNDDAVATFD